MKNAGYILIVAVLFSCVPAVCLSQTVKQPNVAGRFYPAEAGQLSGQIGQFLDQADARIYDQRIPLMIVPHAGYVYSGPTAGYGFKAVSRHHPATVVILAPSHFFSTDKISVWPKGVFETPLGQARVDEVFSEALLKSCESCAFEPRVFEKEHALEVEIPFIQAVFPQAKIVPVIVGQAPLKSLDQFASSLGTLISNRTDVLVVVSTDWSHYYDEKTAWMMDQRGIDLVRKLKVEQLWQDARAGLTELCGLFPVMAAMNLARQQGWDQADVLKTATSADATGDRDRVVGYAAIVFYASGASSEKAVGPTDAPQGLSLESRRRLFEIAEETVRQLVNNNAVYDVKPSTQELNQAQGIFVTLKKHGQLRGCIGRIVTDQPLYQSARDMAMAAASQDPRFSPVRPDELPEMETEISVLSKPKDISNPGDIVLGRDGVILVRDGRQGVFLPQVADETGWTKEKFLSELCSQKAGLPPDCWRDARTSIKTFTAEVFSKQDLQ